MQDSVVEKERVIQWLSRAPVCHGLDSNQVGLMARDMSLRTFAAGETLAAAGEPVTEFWIVVEGELETFLVDARGRERLLGMVRQGETVGEVIIMENSTLRPVRLTARTGGILLTAPADTLRDWIRACPQILHNLFRALSERLKVIAGAAPRKTASPCLGIIVSSTAGELLVGRLATKLLAAGERLDVWASRAESLTHTQSWPATLPVQALSAGVDPTQQPPSTEVERRMICCSQVAGETPDFRPLLSCDEILWLVAPSDASQLERDVHRFALLADDLLAKVRIVWLLGPATTVSPQSTNLKLMKRDVKVFIDPSLQGMSRLELLGLERLTRVLRGVSIGIALAGGGAKGMAHLGVLQVLEEAGLSFDLMSGTSAGAMVGIIYASGMAPLEALSCFQRDLTPSRLFRCLPKWPNWYLVSQYRRRAWDGMLRKYLLDWRLEQLMIPFHSVTVDLVQARTVIRQTGDAVEAILESINLPVVSRPILRDGMALVDGGVLDNLPADVLTENGADFVVGVDVSSHIRDEFAGNRPDMPTQKMRKVGSVDTIFRIFESQSHNLGKLRNRAVDFWIKPDTSLYGLAEFHRAAEIAAAGQTAAQATVADLQHRLTELEKHLFSGPSSRRGSA
jgi:predicted acylesterase/phospholipase RssA/CRP-like cAMP-binding protein